MNKIKNTGSTRREMLAGMGLAMLGLIGLNSIWDKLGNNAATNTWNGETDTPFPNVTLYTHEGEAVRFYDDLIRDKVVAINMMYAQCGDQENWKLLTGTADDIELLRRRLGFFDYEAELDAVKDNHTGMVRIGNAALNRWSMAPSHADPAQIMPTINHLDPKAIHTFHSNYV